MRQKQKYVLLSLCLQTKKIVLYVFNTFIFFVKFLSQKRTEKKLQIERKIALKRWFLCCCVAVFYFLRGQSIAFACSKQPFCHVKAMLSAGKRAAFVWLFGAFQRVFDKRFIGCFAQTIDYQLFAGFCQSSKCLAYLRKLFSCCRIKERFVINFHSEYSRFLLVRKVMSHALYCLCV